MTGPALAAELRAAPAVLFVCSGNMLRSAFAELYARHLGCAVALRSAATTYDNARIHPEAAAALRGRGVPDADVRAFRPRMLAEVAPALPPGTLSFGMTGEHLAALARLPALAPRARLLTALRADERGEIDDPLFTGEYERAFARIAACVDALARALRADEA